MCRNGLEAPKLVRTDLPVVGSLLLICTFDRSQTGARVEKEDEIQFGLLFGQRSPAKVARYKPRETIGGEGYP